MPIVVPSVSGQIRRQFSAWRNFRMPETCVSRPYPAISAAVCVGVMMRSHTPDTTRPIAKPEKPLTKPPAKAARAKRVKTSPSISSLPERGDEHLDGDPSDGEAANPQSLEAVLPSLRRLMHHHPARLQDWIGEEADDRGRCDKKRVADLPAEQQRQGNDPDRCGQPIADRNASEQDARAQNRSDRGGIGALDEALHIGIAAVAGE